MKLLDLSWEIWLTELTQLALLLLLLLPWVWRKWHFSLRAMLVVMTCVAVGLGVVMWAVR